MRNRLLDEGELTGRLASLPGWELAGGRLARTFRFPDFARAFAFMTAAAEHAERLNHHPDWSNSYGTVTVELTSHDLGGVSELCLELAAAMNGEAS